MNKNFLTLNKILVTALAAGLLSPLFLTAADTPQQRPRTERTRPEQRGRGGFPLTDEQQQLYRAALQKYRGELGKLGGQYQETTKDLIKVTLDENFSQDAVREKALALAKIQAQMLQIRAKALAPLAPTLKPEQREQLVQRFGMEILYGRMDRDPRGGRGRPGGR